MAETTGALRLETVLERYADLVLRTALGLVKNRADAEDIAQDVFVSLVRAQPRFESEEHCRAWLIRVTINRCKSFFRSAWQSRTQGMEEEFPDASFTPAESTVTQAVNALPEKYRRVVVLYYIGGYSTAEIAALCALPQNTVLSQLSRARGLLRKSLKGDFDDA